MGMSRTVRIPDPVYADAKQEANERDISRGAVIAEWRDDAKRLDELRENNHRLLDAEPASVPEDAPRDGDDDPVFDSEGEEE